MKNVKILVLPVERNAKTLRFWHFPRGPCHPPGGGGGQALVAPPAGARTLIRLHQAWQGLPSPVKNQALQGHRTAGQSGQDEELTQWIQRPTRSSCRGNERPALSRQLLRTEQGWRGSLVHHTHLCPRRLVSPYRIR